MARGEPLYQMIYHPLTEDAAGVSRLWWDPDGALHRKTHWFVTDAEADDLMEKMEAVEDMEFFRKLINYKHAKKMQWDPIKFRANWPGIQALFRNDPSKRSLAVEISKDDYELLLELHGKIP